MWKNSLVLVCALAACDGGGSSGGATPVVSAKSLAGKSFSATVPSMQIGNGYNSPNATVETVQFNSASQITVNGILLTKGSDGVFRSADSTLALTVSGNIDGLSTDQILYMMANQTLGGTDTLTPMVAGNVTATANIPQSGTATYAGKMVLYDDVGNRLATMDGPVVVVSLATADVTGGVTFAGSFAALKQTRMANGNFSTTMQSGESTPRVTGTINGQLYGSSGSEMGGTLSLEFGSGGTPTDSYVGYYGAALQQ